MRAAIVTGAAGAIGRAIAGRLAAAGHPVLCADRDDGVQRTCDEILRNGGRAAICVADLTEPSAGDEIAAAVARLGGAAVLVNNAGITRDARAIKLDPADYRAVLRVNLVAPLRLAEALAPRLADGGSVINISSRAALGNFGQANYVTAKSALIGATRALAMRWAPRLRVNSVAPGLIETPMTAAMPSEVLEKLVGRIPAGRAGVPDDVARVVAFLASESASYMTGQTLIACGGRSIAG